MKLPLLAAFIALDMIVTAAVILVVIRRKGLVSVLGFDVRKVMAVSREMETESEQYLRANWSGDPSTLAPALAALLQNFADRAAAEGLTLGREQLKPLLIRVIEAKHLAKSEDVREAMKQVA